MGMPRHSSNKISHFECHSNFKNGIVWRITDLWSQHCLLYCIEANFNILSYSLFILKFKLQAIWREEAIVAGADVASAAATAVDVRVVADSAAVVDANEFFLPTLKSFILQASI